MNDLKSQAKVINKNRLRIGDQAVIIQGLAHLPPLGGVRKELRSIQPEENTQNGRGITASPGKYKFIIRTIRVHAQNLLLSRAVNLGIPGAAANKNLPT